MTQRAISEEFEQMFYHFPTYNMQNLLGCWKAKFGREGMLDYQRLSEASRIFKFKNGGNRQGYNPIHKIANEAWIIKEPQIICTKTDRKMLWQYHTHTSCNPLNQSGNKLRSVKCYMLHVQD